MKDPPCRGGFGGEKFGPQVSAYPEFLVESLGPINRVSSAEEIRRDLSRALRPESTAQRSAPTAQLLGLITRSGTR